MGVLMMDILIPIYNVLHNYLIHGKKMTKGYQKSKWYVGMLLLPLNWFSQVRTQRCLIVTIDKLS